MMATYTGYVVYQFKRRHMGLHSFANAAELIFGPVGKWLIEIMQILILIFIMAAHILTFTVEMNVLTSHGTCTIIFGVIGTIVSFALTLPRTFRGISTLSIICTWFSSQVLIHHDSTDLITACLSITASTLITMIWVGIKHPDQVRTYAITPSYLTDFAAGCIAVSNIVVAYAGHVAFFGFISEMEKPQDFPKALVLLQTTAISFYIVVAVVIYRFVGVDVASPALTSASPTVAKIAWGMAMPTIIIAGVVNASIVVKNQYVRIWRDWKQDKEVMSEHSFRSWGSWVGLCALSWLLAWIIASSIPVFSDLLGLLGALFCSWFSLGLPTIFWFHMNKGEMFRDWRTRCLFFVNVMILLSCCVVVRCRELDTCVLDSADLFFRLWLVHMAVSRAWRLRRAVMPPFPVPTIASEGLWRCRC